MKLLSDYPSLVDQLGRAELVRQIAQVAEHGQAPLVLGLHGDWGTGKTSILHQVEFALSGACSAQSEEAIKLARQAVPLPSADTKRQVKTVWFEAWRYQNEAAPIVALLHEIRTQLAAYQKIGNSVGKLAAVAVRGALLSLEDLTKKIGFQASKIEQAGHDWEQAHFASVLPSNAIREQLEAAIGQLLSAEAKDKQRRVVIFIDDLDRCDADAAFRLLEGLKLYLTLNNCVFILGMNQQIVEEAIGKQMQVNDELERKQRAAAYVEKICQNIWRMHPVPRSTAKEYLLSLLPDNVYLKWIADALGEIPCLPPNPRRLKGLANLLTRYAAMMSSAIERSEDTVNNVWKARLIVIVALIHQFHHDYFRHWQAHPKLWGKLWRWCVFVPPFDTPCVSLPAEAGSNNNASSNGGASTSSNPASNSNPAAVATDLSYQLLRPLKRVRLMTKDKNSATPQSSAPFDSFIDPADTNVCWAQPLVLALWEEAQSDAVMPKSHEMHPFVLGLSWATGAAIQ